MTRIAIFDDNERVRNSLHMLLDGSPGMEVTGVFEDAVELQKKMEQSMPDLVLMDIDMPGVNGIEAAKQIRIIFPKIVIIMQTIFDDEERIFQSLKAGAQGYLTKDAPPLKIVSAIEEAMAGGSPMTPGIARKVINYFTVNQSDQDEFNLSQREKEILQLLSEGLSYKMIAAKLTIAYETVHSHIRKIYQKLQVNSLGEALSLAFRRKIIS
jgi:DNA-binding NarL/FixJ family response regulator